MLEIFRPLSSAEVADQRVEFLPARAVMTTITFPAVGSSDVAVVYYEPDDAPVEHSDDVTTGDVTGGDGGTGGGTGGGQGGGNGGNGGDGGAGGDGGDGGNGGDGIGGDGIGGAGIGGDGGGNVNP